MSIFNNIEIDNSKGKFVVKNNNGEFILLEDFIDTLSANIDPFGLCDDTGFNMGQVEGIFKFLKEYLKMNYKIQEEVKVSSDVQKVIDSHVDKDYDEDD